ncbi:MAG: hypothetical protein IJV83_04265 [Clostridia bacterium]|nr:hypothetical protein [Clostridia bacterium]
MNYVKKMCILRQIKQGFSGDGKTLSGLIKIEQYGKNLAVEISIINFAPLSTGEYYCLLSDGKGKTEMLSLRGKSMFNILSDIDISSGFCGIICYVKNDVIPIAYGINGNGNYDWRTILNTALPPVFPKKSTGELQTEIAETKADAVPHSAQPTNAPSAYDDESVAEENYFAEEITHEQKLPNQNCQNAHAEISVEENEKTRRASKENGNAEDVCHPFKTDSDGYYTSVKGELDELFRSYPKDNTLQGAFSCSEWVRIKGTESAPQYLVGVLYEDGRAKYICYALAAQDKNSPPEEIKDVCTFVPLSRLTDSEGFFVIFQSASGGECVKPLSI